jgi:hypothetical protein
MRMRMRTKGMNADKEEHEDKEDGKAKQPF